MKVPFFDYRRELAVLREEVDTAIARVLDSGRLILAEEVAAFEQEFAQWVGSAHAVGVNSGTDALVLALRALEIGAGDEVVTVANAGAPPVAAIRALGARPVFADVDGSTLCMDPASCRAAIGPRSRAIMPVHLYGQAFDAEALLAVANDVGLPLVEDCAQAHGTLWRGRRAGTLGRIACFSFYPTKNLGAYGDGGAVVTDDAELARRVRMERMYGFDGDRVVHREGLNSRLDELQAALLRVKLQHLDAAVDRRREIASRYRAGLAASELTFPDRLRETEHAYHLFVARHPERDALIARLAEGGVLCGIHYADAAHLMPAYRTLELAAEGALPQTERACAEVLSLPMFAGLTDDEVDTVVERALAAVAV